MITKSQLIQTNLIFAEHAKFKEQIPILNNQILTLKQINENLNTKDSIRLTEIQVYKDKINKDNLIINDLKKKNTKAQKQLKIKNFIIVGVSGVCLASLLLNII